MNRSVVNENNEVHYKSLEQAKTGTMVEQKSRSEQVVEAYKRHKLARSALRRIHELVRDFENERAFDRRLAGIGLALLLLVIVLSCLYDATF